MKSLGLLVLLLGVPLWSWLTKVRDRNEAVGTGRAAYAQGRPAQAAQAFAAALDARARRTPDPRLILTWGTPSCGPASWRPPGPRMAGR
jgi:hypothetical protein